MNWQLDFFDGIQTTFEWILSLAIIVIIVITFFIVRHVRKNKKRKTEHEAMYGQLIEEKAKKQKIPVSGKDPGYWTPKRHAELDLKREEDPRKWGTVNLWE